MGEIWRYAGRASEIAHKRPLLRKGGFGVELGEGPSPRLSLSRVVFTVN